MGQEDRKIEGTGIGLTITKELAERIGGAISFDSILREGSTFWFEFPIAADGEDPPEPGQSAKATPVPARKAGSMSVLYVEDNPANLRLMEAIMERVHEAKLESAPNAELGLVMASELHPDIILVDINLPGMSGIDALQRLRSNPRTADIPVIAISADVMAHDVELIKNAGFEAFISKPINIPELLDAIKLHLTSDDR